MSIFLDYCDGYCFKCGNYSSTLVLEEEYDYILKKVYECVLCGFVDEDIEYLD